MTGLTELFRGLVSRIDLVRRHSFDNGYDKGAYFNFTFGTDRPAELWTVMQDSIFQAPAHKTHMATAAMAMCSGEQGWREEGMVALWSDEEAGDWQAGSCERKSSACRSHEFDSR